MREIMEVARLANVCRGFADRHDRLPIDQGMRFLEAVEKLLLVLETPGLSMEEREAARWAADFIRCECSDEHEPGTARTLAVLERIARSA